MSVHHFPAGKSATDGSGGSKGEPPDDGRMEERLRALEDRLLSFESKCETFATKEDMRALEATVTRVEAALHRELHAQTWKLIGVVGVVAAGAFALAKMIHP